MNYFPVMIIFFCDNDDDILHPEFIINTPIILFNN